MLYETYSYALKNKERILDSINSGKILKLLQDAKSCWNECEVESRNSVMCAVDSSWNYIRFHGFYLYAVEGVSLLPDGVYASDPLYEVGLDTLEEKSKVVRNPSLYLQSMGMEFEYMLAMESFRKSDFVMIDGSVLARYYDRREKKTVQYYEHAKDLMKNKNIIFIAKNSDSNSILQGPFGDIYYFNKATSKSGYSKSYHDEAGVTVFYARLEDYSPCIRVEVPGKLKEEECRDVFRLLRNKVFDGYPYALRVAHERCKIGKPDMEKLASILGLDIEQGGREVLGE
jgi:NurA-like 5'-3' nuclease